MVLPGPVERAGRRPPHHPTDPDPGGGWKPDKMPYKTATLRLHGGGLPNAHTAVYRLRSEQVKIGLAAFPAQSARSPRASSHRLALAPCGWLAGWQWGGNCQAH